MSTHKHTADHRHDDARGHDHDHNHGDGHGHTHPGGLRGALMEIFRPHSHDAADSTDAALESSDEGIRALKISLVALLTTAVLQVIVVVFSGSVALLGDTIHNFSDALTAVPLWVAFVLARRAASRRYTYGYGRAEDLAGIFIVLMIAASAIVAGWESVQRLRHPQAIDDIWLVAAAGVVGFIGNELVASYRIRVGRRIGSAALVADGLHARTDGFTSLSVLVGAGGVAIGWDWADPAVGLFITVAILLVLRDAAREVYRRLMDAVDPDLVDEVDRVLRGTEGVVDIGITRLRWIGHQLRAECEIVVDEQLTIVEAHRIAEECQHRLLHEIPRLTAALVHADPAGGRHHELTAHHAAEQRASAAKE